MRNSISTTSNTGYKGIYKREKNGVERYEAHISIPRKEAKGFMKVHVGNYNTLREAVKQRTNYIKNLA